MFVAFFLADMPSYMGLGFETRNTHIERADNNEEYTKLFVFQIREGEKATNGAYEWGKNGALFHQLTRLKVLGETILPTIGGQKIQWLIYPDSMALKKVIVWTQADSPQYVFVANTDLECKHKRFAIPAIGGVKNGSLKLLFSTSNQIGGADKNLTFNGKHYSVRGLEEEECRVYEIE